MKFSKLLFIVTLSMTSFQLSADDDTSKTNQSDSKDQQLIARGGQYRDQSLENRENRVSDRGGNSNREQSLENRQQNAEENQQNRI